MPQKTTKKPSPRAKGPTSKKTAGAEAGAADASRLIDARIAELADWRGQTLQRVRRIITAADPDIVEEWKWETPVWSCGGILCTGETYKKSVKLTFAKGAALADPKGLFNSSLDGKVRRAIDIAEGETIDASALTALIRSAVALNRGGKGSASAPAAGKPKLLTGGNPQIAKGDGDAPVQAYIAAMPGWKGDLGRWLDALIVQTVPHVRKAVRWNTPFYGIDGEGWFLGFHCMTKYVKLAFFRGSTLTPPPPGESKQKHVRYLDVYEKDLLDEKQLTSWIKQAAQQPGEPVF